MQFPGKIILYFIALIFGTALLVSCKDEAETAKPTGNIRAMVNYTPIPRDSCWSHYFSGYLKIELANNDNEEVLLTKLTSQNANIDFGQFPYGNYRIRVTGAVRAGNLCTNDDYYHSTIDTTQAFILDGPISVLNFDITQ